MEEDMVRQLKQWVVEVVTVLK